jgi:hypothetical protein
MAGMMACLLQRYKAIDAINDVPTLLNSVFKSGSLYNNPTDQMGYGIPDFVQAEKNLKTFDSIRQVEKGNYVVLYNSSFKTITIRFTDGIYPKNTTVRIYSMTGSQLVNQPLTESSTVLQSGKFQTGVYAVCVSKNGKINTVKVVVR